MESAALTFKPIDIERHSDLCVRFRIDSYVVSFGSAERFYGGSGNGAEVYVRWLRQRMAEIPNSCVHVWQGDHIIGQLEMRRWRHDPDVGYVNLFYLTPACRGQGLGEQLDRYAADFFREIGCKSARLSVSPTNTMALRFYSKHGWVDLGVREDAPEVHYMEKVYDIYTSL